MNINPKISHTKYTFNLNFELAIYVMEISVYLYSIKNVQSIYIKYTKYFHSSDRQLI